MVEESLENPIGLQTGKTCNRMGTEGARLCDGAVPYLSNLSGKKTELMVMR